MDPNTAPKTPPTVPTQASPPTTKPKPEEIPSTKTTTPHHSSSTTALPTLSTIPKPPALARTWTIHATQLDAYGHVKRGLERDYPAPTETHTVEEMLSFPPLRGSVLYKEKERRPHLNHEKSGEQKKREFEEVKKRLREGWVRGEKKGT